MELVDPASLTGTWTCVGEKLPHGVACGSTCCSAGGAPADLDAVCPLSSQLDALPLFPAVPPSPKGKTRSTILVYTGVKPGCL